AGDMKGKFSLRASITSELFLQDVEVPDSCRLPSVTGLKGPLSCLTQARYGIAWGVIGAAMACYQEALRYSQERLVQGGPLAGKQLTQEKLVFMLTEITKAQLLALRVGRLKDEHKLDHTMVSMAKRNNVDAALQIARLARDLLGNLLEGHLKVVAANALLQQGYSLMEGSNQKNVGRVITLRQGRMHSTLVERPFMAAAPGSEKAKNSPDLRVWEPCRLVVELQVRSQYGSQSALFSDNLLDDLERIRRGTADLFVLAADRWLYEALCGIKRDRRGRKAKHTAALSAALPGCSQLGTSSEPADWPPSKQGDLTGKGALVTAVTGDERCIIGIWRAV
ncbi:MAG: hypothetical protein L0177_20455, partial [Chloroflexi bacterium]|nr:hypothetical protein [Chloroflexota bacterium]